MIMTRPLLVTYLLLLTNYVEAQLQIHVVPHSHDDPGWIKTFDNYYNEDVKSILDSTMKSLAENPKRTFVYSEMSFFKRWWDEQTKNIKTKVKKLVKNKQLEFVNGGWTQADEATTLYTDLIDQMTYGFRFIEETFGREARPTIAWQIDPFGHSAEYASILSQMSFDGLFMARIDERDKGVRKINKTLEFIWRGSKNIGHNSDIFTGVFYDHYSPSGDICYDTGCEEIPETEQPVKDIIDSIIKSLKEEAKAFQTNNLMITMGSDFHYKDATQWFTALDDLVEHSKKHDDINVFYSSPSRYLKALYDTNMKWTLKKGDFFPYSSCEHCYWTGFYTSRPTFKRYIRESSNILQACKQLETLKGNVDLNNASSKYLREEMALNQHHDAVTGTQTEEVAQDYLYRLYNARQECKDLMSKVIGSKYSHASQLHFQYCDYLNISVCRITETEKSVVINVYNPIARPVSTYLQIPIDNKDVVVLGSKGEPIKSQIMQVTSITKSLNPSKVAQDEAKFEITFKIELPALGFSTYFLKRMQNSKNSEIETTVNHNCIQNDYFRLVFSKVGQLKHAIDKRKDKTVNITQDFYRYKSSTDGNQPSGAYIFRPSKQKPVLIERSSNSSMKVVKGILVEEVQLEVNEYISQIVRLYKDQPFIEFEYTIGPLPEGTFNGEEVITRFSTDIKSEGIFYTDANGKEMMKRRKNDKNKFNSKTREPVSSNYYPINSKIFIQDKKTCLSVLTDRPQGGTGYQDGNIEVMLHRRMFLDDALGVMEPLNEQGLDGRGLITRGKHRVLLTTPEEAAQNHRKQGELMLSPPVVSFAVNPYEDIKWKDIPTNFTALKQVLPENIHLLTLETVDKNHMIIRLEHFYEKDEDAKLSKPVTIQLKGLFADFQIISVTELNLSANQLLAEKKMWDWNIINDDDENKDNVPLDKHIADKYEITLQPMQIRTFKIEIKLIIKN